MIEIPGRLHSKATDHVVAGANEILDDDLNKKQSVINAENESFKDAQTELNEAQSDFNSEVHEALGTGGTVDERIANAVNTEKERAESAEEALDGRVDTLEDAVGTGGSVDSRISAAVATETARAQAAEADRYTKSETYTKEEVHNLITTPSQEYVSVTATDQTTAVTDVLPATGAADTTYRVGNWDGTQYNDSVFSEYAWDGSAYIKLSTKSQIGEVYDISANHADTKYADLAAALGTNGANVPQSLRKGGMSVKFVQSSDNNYIQFRYMSSSTAVADFTNVANWQGVDDEPTAGSDNLVKSGSVDNRLSELIGVEYEGNMQTGSVSTNKTPITLKANMKYMIYVQSDDATSAETNYSGIYDGDGGNIIMSVNKNEYLAGKSMIYTPSADMNLYFRTKTSGATVNYKVYSMEVSTIKDIDNLLNDTIVKECWIPIAKDVLTANMVNVGDTVIISAKKAIAGGGDIMTRVNGSSTTLFVTTNNLQTVRYIIPQGFEAINVGNNVVISIKNTKGFANVGELSKLSYAFTDISLINKALKELFVMGSSYPSVNYRAEIVKEATGRRVFTLMNKSTNNAVAFCEITPLTINGTSYNKDNDYIIHGTQQNNSGIEFYAIIDWNELENGRYVLSNGYDINLLGSCFVYKSSPSIIEYLEREKYLSFINPSTFNYKIGYDWSGFISLENVKSIVYRLHKIYNEITFYFYKNEMSSYSSNYLNADYILSYPSDNVARGKIIPPKGYKYFSFRVSDKANDFVLLIKGQGGFDVEKNIRFFNSGKCISNGFVPACGEPNLLYDKETGIVYENYICGEDYGADPEGNLGFAKFPLAAPEQAEFSIAAVFGQTEIDGETITFRDVLNYFYNATTIRNITYGKKGTSEKALYRFDQNLDGVIQNFEKIKFTDNTDVNYTSYNDKIESLGCTPYPAPSESEHYKLLWPSSSHIQEYNGYKYFTLNGTGNCPLICRTSDNFETIEAIKAFQIECHYESALVINNNDWYIFIRGTDFIHYSFSQDGGVTWSTLQTINNSNNSKPRAIMYDGKVVALIPTWCVEDIGNITKNNKDSVLVQSRYSVKIIRGDKTTDINSWRKEVALASKYGQNYGDIFTVGKDLYYAWSCDKTHLHSLPVGGKAQIMLARIGNLDNSTMFGDV